MLGSEAHIQQSERQPIPCDRCWEWKWYSLPLESIHSDDNPQQNKPVFPRWRSMRFSSHGRRESYRSQKWNADGWLAVEPAGMTRIFCNVTCFLGWLHPFSPTAESFGVSAKLGPGALWGSHPARFHEVPRFQVRVPGKGFGVKGSKFQVKVPEGCEVPSKGSRSRRFQGPKMFQVSRLRKVPRFQVRGLSKGSRRIQGSK